jgi:hypothetical protein
VPLSTDLKIKKLFAQAMVAKDETELKRVAKQLRAAIAEHTRLAEGSAAVKASTVSVRDSCSPPVQAVSSASGI